MLLYVRMNKMYATIISGALIVLAVAVVVLSFQVQSLRESDKNIVDSNTRQTQAIEQLRSCLDTGTKPCPAQ